MLSLLLLSSLLHIITSTVYNVIPDDHYYPNTTCHHCHNLQHYLLNATKYFASNTQLFFLPGIHHLHTDFIIQNAHHISLIGSTTNGTAPDTVIQCNSSVGIVITNIANLLVTNITIRNCLGNKYNNAALLIKQCTNVQLRHVVIKESHKPDLYGINGINILGDSIFSYISNNKMCISYNDDTVTISNHSLTIDHYINCNSNDSLVTLIFSQSTFAIKFTLMHSTFERTASMHLLYISFYKKGIEQSIVLIKSCQFTDNRFFGTFIEIKARKVMSLQNKDVTGMHSNVILEDCTFYNNDGTKSLNFINMNDAVNIHIKDCVFYNSSSNGGTVLRTIARNFFSVKRNLSLHITNTSFLSTMVKDERGMIFIQSGNVYLTGPIVFKDILGNSSCIILLQRSTIKLSDYIEFSNISAETIIVHDVIESEHFLCLLMKIPQLMLATTALNTLLNQE